ncbi:unnamed protein product, partial [Anisakis simplex]|uniref:Family 2 glycosyl transferase n=1 Tax=Anisakis simplex TaxID=6269 RepID=A0A0M3JL07_ANISI
PPPPPAPYQEGAPPQANYQEGAPPQANYQEGAPPQPNYQEGGAQPADGAQAVGDEFQEGAQAPIEGDFQDGADTGYSQLRHR